MRIAHASIDERNQARNGTAGNQTGKEVCIRQWYNKPWTVLIRHPDRIVREKIATMAEALASPPANTLIGYDQNERNTFHAISKFCGYDVLEFIGCRNECETDCSAFVTTVCLYAGVKTLEYTGNAPTTSTMKSVFKKAGFDIITDKKVLSTTAYLSKGDILVKPGAHTVIVIDDGALYGKPSSKSYFPKCSPNHTSIAQALDEIGVDSSKSNRKKIYNVNFSDTYLFSAKQNTAMLTLLKDGKLLKP